MPGPVFGDRRLVSILVGNLVDNAIRHNVAGGNVTVRTSHSGRGSIVAVSNSGPVVAEEDVAHLCEPFMRPGNRRRSNGEGYGLGLAIVQSVAHAHRAELRVRARSQGGLAVDVTFPSTESRIGREFRRLSCRIQPVAHPFAVSSHRGVQRDQEEETPRLQELIEPSPRCWRTPAASARPWAPRCQSSANVPREIRALPGPRRTARELSPACTPRTSFSGGFVKPSLSSSRTFPSVVTRK